MSRGTRSPAGMGAGFDVTKVCLYCRTTFQKNAGKRLNTNFPTRDHVYPRTVTLPPKLEKWNAEENQVDACHWCNNRKGQMHPLRWLTYCPSEAGAVALAAILIQLGERETKVDLALKYWRAHNASGET